MQENTPPAQKAAAVVQKNESQLQRTVNLNLPPAQQRILDALASFSVLGVKSVERQTIAVFSKQSPISSAFDAHLRNLVNDSLIVRNGGSYSLTLKGCDAARAEWQSITGNEELLDAWCHYLPAKQGVMLRRLASFYPKGFLRENLAEITVQSPNSSAFDQNLRDLKNFGLIRFKGSGSKRRYFATERLFPVKGGDEH